MVADHQGRRHYPAINPQSNVNPVRPTGNTAPESFLDLLLRQIAADEDDAALAPLVISPAALMIAVEDHVHALEYEPLGIVLERENALAAQDVWSFLLDQVLHPRKEFVGTKRLIGRDRQRLHLLIVIMAQAAVMVRAVIMVVIVSAVIMVMTVGVIVIGLQEFRL